MFMEESTTVVDRNDLFYLASSITSMALISA